MRNQTFIPIFTSLLISIALTSCVKKPDLLPANPHDWAAFCEVDDQNRLVVYVKNQSNTDAPATTTTVEFTWQGKSKSVQLQTPPLPAGETAELQHIDFPEGCFDPDCGFKITVDSNNQINESNEGNNSVIGNCIG